MNRYSRFPRWRGIFRTVAYTVATILGLALFVHRTFPEALPKLLELSLLEALIAALFFLILERLNTVDREIGKIIRKRPFQEYPTREAAYEDICNFLCEDGPRVKRIDLLQFSGVTAIPILNEAAKSCPVAEIRLLLVNYDYAEKFDEPDFHCTRIRHTLGSIRILKESYPELKIGVWSYKTEPGIAGVLIDGKLVSAGWYHVFPSETSPTGLSIRGHRDPTVVALHGASPELFAMVRNQFDTVLSKAEAADLSKSPK